MKGFYRADRCARKSRSLVARIAVIAGALLAGGQSASWVAAPASAQGSRNSKDVLVQKLTGKNLRVDKTTGRVRRATEQEARETVEQLAAVLPGPETVPEVYQVGRAFGARVNGTAATAVVIRPRSDGTFETRCVGTLEEAVAFLSGELTAERER